MSRVITVTVNKEYFDLECSYILQRWAITNLLAPTIESENNIYVYRQHYASAFYIVHKVTTKINIMAYLRAIKSLHISSVNVAWFRVLLDITKNVNLVQMAQNLSVFFLCMYTRLLLFLFLFS